MRFYFTLALKN